MNIKRAVEQLSGSNVMPKCKHKNSVVDMIEDSDNLCADKQGRVVVVHCHDCGYLTYLHPEAAYDLVHQG